MKHVGRINLLRIALLRDGYLGSDLQKIGSASDICYTMGHVRQKLGRDFIRILVDNRDTKSEGLLAESHPGVE